MLVVYHDAWTYFARDYGLDMITAVQPADFSEPSASEVRAIIDLIRELGVTVVFGSEVFPTPVLEAIAEETGARYVADLSDDALPGAPGSAEHTYLELMRRNARAIVDGLGGTPVCSTTDTAGRRSAAPYAGHATQRSVTCRTPSPTGWACCIGTGHRRTRCRGTTSACRLGIPRGRWTGSWWRWTSHRT
jgi:hypothetical protein